MNILISYNDKGIDYDVPCPECDTINLAHNAYNSNWLYEQVVLGKITEVCAQEIVSMADILESIYSGLWDIQIAKKLHKYKLLFKNEGAYGLDEYTEEREIPSIYFKILIKFPKITISNTSNASHEISDLFVMTRYEKTLVSIRRYHGNARNSNNQLIHNPDLPVDPLLVEHNGFYLKFDPSYKITQNILGVRSTLTIAEFKSGYIHSHLNSYAENNYRMDWINYFCLGSGEIVITLGNLASNYSPELFTLYLYQLDAYVRWESTEGTPYISFSQVVGTKKLNKIPRLTISSMDNYLSLIRQREIRRSIGIEEDNFFDITGDSSPEVKLNWTIDNNKFKIIEDSDFEYFIRLYSSPDQYESDRAKFIFFTDKSGNLYSCVGSTTLTIPTDIDSKTFLFRGDVVTLSITTQDAIELEPDFIIHPEIKNYVKHKLEKYVNYNRFKDNIVKRAIRFANPSGSI